MQSTNINGSYIPASRKPNALLGPNDKYIHQTQMAHIYQPAETQYSAESKMGYNKDILCFFFKREFEFIYDVVLVK